MANLFLTPSVLPRAAASEALPRSSALTDVRFRAVTLDHGRVTRSEGPKSVGCIVTHQPFSLRTVENPELLAIMTQNDNPNRIGLADELVQEASDPLTSRISLMLKELATAAEQSASMTERVTGSMSNAFEKFKDSLNAQRQVSDANIVGMARELDAQVQLLRTNVTANHTDIQNFINRARADANTKKKRGWVDGVTSVLGGLLGAIPGVGGIMSRLAKVGGSLINKFGLKMSKVLGSTFKSFTKRMMGVGADIIAGKKRLSDFVPALVGGFKQITSNLHVKALDVFTRPSEEITIIISPMGVAPEISLVSQNNSLTMRSTSEGVWAFYDNLYTVDKKVPKGWSEIEMDTRAICPDHASVIFALFRDFPSVFQTGPARIIASPKVAVYADNHFETLEEFMHHVTASTYNATMNTHYSSGTTTPAAGWA